MKRRPLVLSPWLLLAGLPPARAQRGTPQAAPLTDQDRADLARIEAYLNGMTTLRARFVQSAHNGAVAEGTAMIWRPGRMRFDYDPPEPLLLIANAGEFVMYDREMRQPSSAPVSATPLGVLLRPTIRLSGDVTVTRVERQGGMIGVSLFRTAAPNEGQLTLIFNAEPMELRQWVVTDPQGRVTRVALSRIEVGPRLEASCFQANRPGFFDEQDQLCPPVTGRRR